MAAQAAIGARQRHLLELIRRGDLDGVWRSSGHRNAVEWVSAELGISNWVARRWIVAGHALPALPHVEDALADGSLSFDKVLELCRFASPDTEQKLITWASPVTVRSVRERADAETQRGASPTPEMPTERPTSTTGTSMSAGSLRSKVPFRPIGEPS